MAQSNEQDGNAASKTVAVDIEAIKTTAFNGWNFMSDTAHRADERTWPVIEAVAHILFRYLPEIERRRCNLCGEPFSIHVKVLKGGCITAPPSPRLRSKADDR